MGDVSTSATTQETSLKMKGRRLIGVLMAAALAVGGVAAAPTTAMADENGPQVTVTDESGYPLGAGVSPAGEELTIKGTGFTPKAPDTNGERPPLLGKFAGTYVTFGAFQENWKPSAGAPSSARKNFATHWAVPAADMTTIGGPTAGAIELREDGSFEVKIRVSPQDAASIPEGGKYGIYTYSGGGATYAGFETFTPITFFPATATTDVTNADPTGLNVKTTVAGIPAGINGAYAAIIEKGTEAQLSGNGSTNYVAMEPFVQVSQGAAAFTLVAPRAKLDRAKDYVVIIWKQHMNATPENIYAIQDIDVTEAQWDAVFAAASTKTAVKFSKSSVKYNAASSATVTVSSDAGVPSGKATLKVAGQTYNANLSKGKATIKLSKAVKVGSQKASVSFTSSDSDFKNSSTSATLKVTKATPKVTGKLVKSKIKANQNPKVKVSASIPGSLKAKASKFKVEVYDGKKKIKTQRLSTSGKATVTLKKLKPGNHKIKVKLVASKNTTSKTSVAKTLKVVK